MGCFEEDHEKAWKLFMERVRKSELQQIRSGWFSPRNGGKTSSLKSKKLRANVRNHLPEKIKID